MIKYYSNDIIEQCKIYAEEKAPEEMCGFIIEDDEYRFIPIENIAKDKINNFSISVSEYIKYADDLCCIVHSHNNSPHVSAEDQQLQKRADVQCGIMFLKNGKYSSDIFFGGNVRQDLLGRPFVFGAYDCFSIVRDYYYKELNINLPNIIREYGFWNDREVGGILKPAEDIINNNLNDFIKTDINNIEKGDIITMNIQGKVTNHLAVYIGNGLILHHLNSKLSTREPVYGYMNMIENIYRWEK